MSAPAIMITLVHRCIPSHWSGAAAVDGLCCYGIVLSLCGHVFSYAQMVMNYIYSVKALFLTGCLF